MNQLQEIFERSINHPEQFWGKAAEALHWYKRWDQVLDDSNPPFYRWFSGGELNTCYNAVDRHVDEGYGEQPALIYDSPVTDTIKTYSYRELRDTVAIFAGVLAGYGISKGDRVIIYMPMVPEVIIAMLAVARLGAVHSVVFGGFAANELADRIEDAQPRIILSASCGLEPGRIVEYKPLLDQAIALSSHKPTYTIILQRPMAMASMTAGRDMDWEEVIIDAKPHECVPVAATDPLYILYTSGSTGQPKGVVRDNGGHAVALKWTMPNIYAAQPGDVYWAASDVGWIVGHSYIVYGPLLNRNTTVLYEGKPVGTPDPGAFWRVIERHRIKTLFTAPTALRAIKKEDPSGEFIDKYDLSGLNYLFLAGERCDPNSLHWAEQKLGIPVIDHWWQTETGWSICSNCVGIETLPIKPGSAARPVPGMNLHCLDSNGNKAKPGDIGSLAIKLPLPPGCFPSLWNADELFVEKYMSEFDGYYTTADAGYIDEDGYVFVMSRTDDVINVAGHRLSTGAIEEVLASHPDVAECAVFGVEDQLKGQLPLGLLVLKVGVERDESEIVGDVVKMVRDRIGPVAVFKQATVVNRLPKTRSGKILRGTMQKIADQREYKIPATIEDPAVLTEIKEALVRIGYAGGHS